MKQDIIDILEKYQELYSCNELGIPPEEYEEVADEIVQHMLKELSTSLQDHARVDRTKATKEQTVKMKEFYLTRSVGYLSSAAIVGSILEGEQPPQSINNNNK